MSSIGDFFGGITSTMGQGFWPAAISSAAMLASGLFSKEPESTNYAGTKEGFEAQMALEQDKLAQALAIAKLNAASSGSAAGTAAKIAQDTAMRQTVMKQLGDNLAYKLDAKKSGMQAIERARQSILEAKQKQAELMALLYQNAGTSLMRGVQ